MIAREDREALTEALDCLPGDMAEVLQRKYLQEQTDSQIAREMGSSVGKVQRLMTEAMEKLRALPELAEMVGR